MPLYVLDTNHACRLLDQDDPLWMRMGANPNAVFAISLATLGELAFMVEKSRQRVGNRARLYAVLAELLILPFGEDEAILSGGIRAEAQRAGYNLTAIDTQVAAVVMYHEAVLLTSDSDFRAVPGIECANWLIAG